MKILYECYMFLHTFREIMLTRVYVYRERLCTPQSTPYQTCFLGGRGSE